jgi:hypothetical protein
LPLPEGSVRGSERLLVLCPSQDYCDRVCAALVKKGIPYTQVRRSPLSVVEFGCRFCEPVEVRVHEHDYRAAQECLGSLPQGRLGGDS